MIVNVEIKNCLSDPAFDVKKRTSERIMELLDARRNVDRVLISCFAIAGLDRFQSERPDLETAHLVLSRRPAEEVVTTCSEHGHSSPCLDDRRAIQGGGAESRLAGERLDEFRRDRRNDSRNDRLQGRWRDHAVSGTRPSTDERWRAVVERSLTGHHFSRPSRSTEWIG